MSATTAFLADEPSTLACGAALAQALQGVRAPQALVIYLEGQLGAGKTTLTRGVLHALGHRGKVKSPTYTLVEPYGLPQGALYHFDLYRLKDPQELEFLGAQEYFSHGRVCLVEWPGRGAGCLPPADIVIKLAAEQAGRRFDMQACTPAGECILKTFCAQGFTRAAK